jgi:hypothetical protein
MITDEAGSVVDLEQLRVCSPAMTAVANTIFVIPSAAEGSVVCTQLPALMARSRSLHSRLTPLGRDDKE